MILHVKEARYVRDYVLWLRFSDGAEGEVDLRDELQGEVFEPLKNPCAFRQFAIDPDMQTVVWKSGADFAPEFLYEHLMVVA